jgi:transposase InsO family protein
VTYFNAGSQFRSVRFTECPDELELATQSSVHWFNEDRLHGCCNDVLPEELEAAFSAA